MEELKFILYKVITILMWISTFILLLLIFTSTDSLIREMNMILLVNNLITLYPLTCRLKQNSTQLFDPIIYILLFFVFAYIWNTAFQINSSYFQEKLAHSRYSLTPFIEQNKMLLWGHVAAFVMIQFGYALPRYFIRGKTFDISWVEIESLGYKIGGFELFYFVLLLFKCFVYFTGLKGSGSNLLAMGGVSAVLNVLITLSTVMLLVVYIKHYEIHKRFFYFCFSLETACIFISGDRRNFIYLLITIIISAIYKGYIINMRTLSRYALLFFLILWPLMNLGNDLANYKMISGNRDNLNVNDIAEYLLSDKENFEKNNTQHSGVYRILVTEHFTQNLVAYDNMALAGYHMGPKGIENIVMNLLPGFIVKRTDNNYIIDEYQQYAFNNHSKQKTVLAFDLIAELIMSYGLLGVLFIFFTSAFWSFLYIIFSSSSIIYKLFFLCNYYHFSFGIFDNRIVGDTVTFYKMLMMLFFMALFGWMFNVPLLKFTNKLDDGEDNDNN